jgi:predicted nucleic acid-binding protein
MGKIRDVQKRNAIIRLYKNTIVDEVELSEKGLIRAHVLHLKGLGFMDSHHLIAAETAGAGSLLTTDKAFIRICKERNLSRVNVINPLDF